MAYVKEVGRVSPTKDQSSSQNTDFKVRVAIRVRPVGEMLGDNELTRPGTSSLPHTNGLIVSESAVQLNPPHDQSKKTSRMFAFDRCFPPSSTQLDIYRDFGQDLVDHAIEGYNACIFAYGQTGSGKTHTMMGTERDPGLVLSICQNLFTWVREVQATTAVTIRLSMLEVYNEQVRDLLQPTAKVRVRSLGSDCIVDGLSEYKVGNLPHVISLLAKGNQHRATAATKMNDQSSRSHAVISLAIKQQHIQNVDSKVTQEKVSLVRLVDLAGSERAGLTGATGDRLKEGSNINQSLVILGRVISTLAELAERPSTKALVPYRESVLTRLLQTSLSGNSRTAMIACVSPDEANYEQTLSTLRYADQAKKITTKAKINEDVVSLDAHRERLATMERELSELKQQLTSARTHEAVGEESKLAALVRFYEDEMARQEVRSRMLEAQRTAAETHNIALSDFVREITGQGLSSLDTAAQRLTYEDLMAERQQILVAITRGRESMHASVDKWSKYVQTP